MASCGRGWKGRRRGEPPHAKRLRAIDLFSTQVQPRLRAARGDPSAG